MLHNKYEKIPKHISEEPHSGKCESGWFTYQFYYVVKILTFTSHMANEKKHLHRIFFQHIKNIVLYFGCDNLQLEGCKHTHRTGVAENRVHAKPTTVTQTWHHMFSFIVFKNQYVFIYSPSEEVKTQRITFIFDVPTTNPIIWTDFSTRASNLKYKIRFKTQMQAWIVTEFKLGISKMYHCYGLLCI